MAFTSQEGAEFNQAGEIQYWTQPVSGGILHLTATNSPNGATRSLAAAFQNTGETFGAAFNTDVDDAIGATLDSAAVLGGVLTRTGPTANFEDELEPAQDILAAWPGGIPGASVEVTFLNTTLFLQTIASPGASVVLVPARIVIPRDGSARFLVSVTGADEVTFRLLGLTQETDAPTVQYAELDQTTDDIPLASMSGASYCVMENVNAVPGAQLVPSAVALLAGIPNAFIGYSYTLRIMNSAAGTLTLTTDTGATMTMVGTMTVAEDTWRDFIVTISAADAGSVRAIGAGTL